MRHEVLKRLKDAGGFVSGEKLGDGVTRAALWKHIKAMKADGADIESITGRGYRLVSPPDVPRAEYVSAYTTADAKVFYKDVTTSTNDDAKQAGRDGQDRAVFIAGRQESGRGRKGRVWSSPTGGLYITFLVRPDIEAEKAVGITLMAAVALCEAVEKTAGVSPKIKWPNDALVNGKKLSGILTESMMSMDGVEYAVCGIGTNTGTNFVGELAEKACSINVNKTLLAAALTDSFFDGYDKFLSGGFASFMHKFRERNALSGEVTVTSAGGSETGEFSGFDDSGALLLRREGEVKRYVAGEVTLRGGGIYA